jgi:hypothetical protein
MELIHYLASPLLVIMEPMPHDDGKFSHSHYLAAPILVIMELMHYLAAPCTVVIMEPMSPTMVA